MRLDGDNLRHGLCSDLGFTAACRHENVRRVGEVAALGAASGLVVLAALVSPTRVARAAARAAAERVGGGGDGGEAWGKAAVGGGAGAGPATSLSPPSRPPRFIEVHCRASVDVCASRDPKGLYARAAAGQLSSGLTGVAKSASATYEAPEPGIDGTADTTLSLATDGEPGDDAAVVVAALERLGVLLAE